MLSAEPVLYNLKKKSVCYITRKRFGILEELIYYYYCATDIV